jgi:hypothetical protein
MTRQYAAVLCICMALYVVSMDSTDIVTAMSVASSSSSDALPPVEANVGSPLVMNYKMLARNVVCNMTSAFPALNPLTPSPWACPSVVNLTATWCNFTGVYCRPATGKLPAPVYMQYIFLSGQGIMGTLPTALGQLTQLERLVLDTNQIYGTIPSALAGMASLRALYLNRNSLKGTVPLALTTLTNLQVLNVNFNYMTGTLPAWFTTHTYNNDTGSGPSTYAQLTAQPTGQPTDHPTQMPLNSPRPTRSPTKAPSQAPSLKPSVKPTVAPSARPTTATRMPSKGAVSKQPSSIPTYAPFASAGGLPEGSIAAAVVLSIVGAAGLAWFVYKCFIEEDGDDDPGPQGAATNSPERRASMKSPLKGARESVEILTRV